MELLQGGGRADLGYTVETKLNVQAGFGAVFYKWQDSRQFKNFTYLNICTCVNVKLKKKKGKWVNILAHSSA